METRTLAGLIRSEKLPAPNAFSFRDIESSARAILERAETQAARILEQAQDRARKLAEQQMQVGYQRGVERGRAAGLEQIRREARQSAAAEARQRIDALSGALSAGLAEFEHNKRRLLAVAESGLITLALSIAKRACKIIVAQSSQPAQANVRHLLELVGGAADLKLLVNPADHDAIQDMAAGLLEGAKNLEHVEILADPAVGRGDCMLHTRQGVIDATIDEQLQRIAEQISAGDDYIAVERERAS